MFIFTNVGYEVYLVGGCVRDLVLRRTPKDFDILTSAELKEVFFFVHLEPKHQVIYWKICALYLQVMRAFPRCEIVGRRFPICHVHVDDAIVEVGLLCSYTGYE